MIPDWAAISPAFRDWAATPVGTAVLAAVVGALTAQLLTWWSRRRTARDRRRDQLVAAAVELVAAANTVHVALNLHAVRWLGRRARLETAGLAALDWWAGKAEHGPPVGAARAVRTVLEWNREGQAVAADVARPRALFNAALGRWTVLADPRDLDDGLALDRALEELAHVHAGPARRRRAAEQALEHAGTRVITAARARTGRRGERRAARRILRSIPRAPAVG